MASSAAVSHVPVALSAGEPKARLHFIDSLRALLPVMVIVVHAGITYGGGGAWFYVEGATDPVSPVVLTLVNVLAQSFGMGFFFMVAGYFTPKSLDRKGPGRFVASRLTRLGTPLVLFALLVSPVLEYTKRSTLAGRPLDFGAYLYRFFRHFDFIPGPLWFVEVLLVLTAGYGLLRSVRRSRQPAAPTRGLRQASIVAFALTLTVGEFVVRLAFRPGEEFCHLQLAYFFQYVMMFAVGVVTSRNDWGAGLGEGIERLWTRIAIVLALALPAALALAAGLGALGSGPPPADALGGWHLLPLVLAAWESFYCVAMAITLPAVFRRRFNRPGRLTKALAENSYAMFFIHAPVLVGLGLALRFVTMPSVLKFALVAPSTVLLCLVLSEYGLRRMPGLRAVL